jgi:RNA polymerase sigma factor FliA
MTKNAPDTRDALIESYQEYTRAVARQLMRSHGLPTNLFDEFVAAGNLGLVEAAERFDFREGVEFKNFAFLRIRGAIIDSIRQSSHLSRKAYRRARALEAMYDSREQENQLDASKPRLDKILEIAARGALSFRLSMADAEDEVSRVESHGQTPEALLDAKKHYLLLCKLVQDLPDRERYIIEQYYFRGASFREIAEGADGMSKSWVSRLHSRGLELLRSRYEAVLEQETK